MDSRAPRLVPVLAGLLCVSVLGCSAGDDGSGNRGDGPGPSSGGTSTSMGGIPSAGGSFATGGSAGFGSGGLATGGAGGLATGGAGGLATGGAGGLATGGAGGLATGGTGAGGEAGSSFGGAAGLGTGGTDASGGTAGQAGSNAGGAGAGGSGSGGGGSGGSGTAGTGGCQKPAAPTGMQTTIDLTWQEMTGGFQGETGARPVSAGVQNFENTVLDQVMDGAGTLNFCVRYESNVTVTAAQRDKVLAALQRGVNEWFDKLTGYDCFPYDEIVVKITGWATVNRSTFDWPDGVVPLFINQIGYENVAQCPDACSRFVRYHHQGQDPTGYAYPNCAGGAANRFDMHLWLTEGFANGVGGDWGQRVGRSYYMNGVDNEHLHIWLHEFGHGLGFPDYYNWEAWVSGVARPPSIMVAGAAALVTEWDMWMLRHTYSSLKSRL